MNGCWYVACGTRNHTVTSDFWIGGERREQNRTIETWCQPQLFDSPALALGAFPGWTATMSLAVDAGFRWAEMCRFRWAGVIEGGQEHFLRIAAAQDNGMIRVSGREDGDYRHLLAAQLLKHFGYIAGNDLELLHAICIGTVCRSRFRSCIRQGIRLFRFGNGRRFRRPRRPARKGRPSRQNHVWRQSCYEGYSLNWRRLCLRGRHAAIRSSALSSSALDRMPKNRSTTRPC